MSIPTSITKDSIVVTLKGKPRVIPRNNRLADDILEAVRDNDIYRVEQLVDRALALSAYSKGSIKITHGEVFYKGDKLHNAVVPKLIKMFEMGLDIDPWINFVDKLMANPSHRSREQLYRFIEANDVAITEEGDLLLYKWVTSDYLDCHTRSIKNTVGSVVEMDRSQVDDDPNRTCSAGLHACSQGYCKFGERLMYIQVDPADVVSIPVDYNNSKMRVCKYVVHAEVDPTDYEFKDWSFEPVYGQSGTLQEEDDDSDIEWIVLL